MLHMSDDIDPDGSKDLQIMRGVVFGLAISLVLWLIIIGGVYLVYRALG